MSGPARRSLFREVVLERLGNNQEVAAPLLLAPARSSLVVAAVVLLLVGGALVASLGRLPALALPVDATRPTIEGPR